MGRANLTRSSDGQLSTHLLEYGLRKGGFNQEFRWATFNSPAQMGKDGVTQG